MEVKTREKGIVRRGGVVMWIKGGDVGVRRISEGIQVVEGVELTKRIIMELEELEILG
jgi:hypothetical protein